MNTFDILVDGKACAMLPGRSLDELVASLGHEPQAVTTAVNGEFVPRAQRAQRLLQPGDAVLLFRPIVGG